MSNGAIPGVREELYLGDRYSSREELEESVDFWDASTASAYGRCPRYAQYLHEMQVVPSEDALPLAAGSALHAALAVLYATDRNAELAIEALRADFGEREPLPSGSKFSHLHLGHLEVVLNNYIQWSRKHDTFEPLVVRVGDLDFSQVEAAVLYVTPDERVILGESKFVMRFEVDGEEFIYAGRPDLPTKMSGGLYIVDHKSTSGYLSEWWGEQYQFSNQLRGYCKMIETILGERIQGALINALYVGGKASNPDFKGNRFARFGPFAFRPSHLDEAIRNQYVWRELRFAFLELDYWPQNTGKMCQGCMYGELCRASPKARSATIRHKYSKGKTEFLDL